MVGLLPRPHRPWRGRLNKLRMSIQSPGPGSSLAFADDRWRNPDRMRCAGGAAVGGLRFGRFGSVVLVAIQPFSWRQQS